MKRNALRFSFIATILLSSALGFPGQARAENGGGCDASVQRHRTITTADGASGLSGIALEMYGNGTKPYYDQIAADNPGLVTGPDYKILASWPGHDVVLTICPMASSAAAAVSQRTAKSTVRTAKGSFAQPARVLSAGVAAVSAAATIGTLDTPPATQLPQPEVELPIVAVEAPPLFAAESPKPIPSAPKPVLSASLLPQAHAPPLPAPELAPRTRQVTAKAYEVTLTIRPDVAQTNGIAAGTFPALLTEDQKPDGEWSRKRKMVAAIQKNDQGYLCRLVFKKRPSKNSMVLVDLENGNALPVAGDLLRQGDASDTTLPDPFKDKAYAALNRTVPVKSNWLFSTLRFVLPVSGQSVMSLVATGFSPIGLATVPTSLITNLATRKIGANQRAKEALRHPSLHMEQVLTGVQDDIDALKQQNERLQERIRLLEQNATATGRTQEVAQ